MRLGVNLPQYSVDFDDGILSLGAAVAFAIEAERVGVDSVWASDHPFVIGPDGNRYPALDPVEMLDAIARATSRLKVGTLVFAASRRGVEDVMRATKQLARAAGERAIIGLGAGWYTPEFPDGLPPFDERLYALERCARSVSGEARILIGGGHERVLDIAAKFAQMWNLSWDQTPEAFAAARARLDEACASANRDPRDIERSIGLTIAPGDLADQIARVRGRARFLNDLDPSMLAERVVHGDVESITARLKLYAADEVIVTLFVRDDPAPLRALVGALHA